MPFVIMCGLPSSGKTYYATLLADYLKNTLNKTVHVINDNMFINNKNEIYIGKLKFYFIISYILLFIYI
jgi:tRNA uridine 5-carbamoylmethylation protein Kti12